MKKFIKTKFGTIIVLFATVVLAGISIFTAYRLYKLRQEAVAPNAPTSEPAAAACTEQCPGSDGILRNCHPPDSDGTAQESVCNSNFRGRVERCGTTYDYCCDGSWKKISVACNSSTLGNTRKCGETNICCDGTKWTKTMTACNSQPTEPPLTQCQPLSFSLTLSSASPSPSPSPQVSPSPSPSPQVSPSPSPSPSTTASSVASPSQTSTTNSETEAELPEAGTALPTYLGLGTGIILLVISLLIAL